MIRQRYSVGAQRNRMVKTYKASVLILPKDRFNKVVLFVVPGLKIILDQSSGVT